MNTRTNNAAYLKEGLEYVFCNEDLEPAFERTDMETITNKWNNGESLHDIAKVHKRDPDEIFLAIFHQAREGKITRKLNCPNPIEYVKIKKGIPTVINYDGRRYVFEP